MSKINYIETKIYTTSAGVEPVLALLLNRSIDRVSVQDNADYDAIVAAKDELKWDYIDESLAGTSEAVVTFYTGAEQESDALLSEVKIDLVKLKSDEMNGAYGADADFGRLYMESMPLEDDWKEKWKENFKPFRATPRIAVSPSWDTPDEDGAIESELKGADIVIRIDPGMAFGTGAHETTSMCLNAIEDALSGMNASKHRSPDSLKAGSLTSSQDAVISLLDLGTGTGILAIAAVKLGATTVVAAEYDEDGIAAARDNIALNGATNEIKLLSGDVTEAAVQTELIRANGGAKYDIIAANIHKNLLVKIMPDMAAMINKGGRLILSGLLEEDEEAITKAARSTGFLVDNVIRKGEWLAICVDFL
jgi:ribosomal protein L11 methyltransferase